MHAMNNSKLHLVGRLQFLSSGECGVTFLLPIKKDEGRTTTYIYIYIYINIYIYKNIYIYIYEISYIYIYINIIYIYKNIIYIYKNISLLVLLLRQSFRGVRETNGQRETRHIAILTHNFFFFS